ncbi:zinc finger CCHC domain-containing protein 8 isoform X2 [Seriola aureovittata]|uniref:zinc finger CCHC domain-containing protein 8 isoform X2 n=2 Tax=Seriola aureovittata TaxID=2871759 RepID=UPI0024BEC872|nr:zinc finger CCHC domain-containing protein 8 isoform X2 [Seriola aureovittata]
MAEVDFGDSELFQQLDESAPSVPTHIRFPDEEEDQEETSQLRGRLEECDDYIQRLTEENKGLRRKLNILARPSGITIEDVNIDGPLLQILYANNNISKQCRQEIEDCICSVILKHQKLGHGKKKSSFHHKPQNSAFAMDEDLLKSSSTSVRTKTEAFKVVGSVLYFTTFSVDKLGQPLVNESPQLTDGWDIPTYHQVFNQVVGTDGQEIEMKDKRPKSMCFNCGSSSHQLRDCPNPKDMAAINERRKEFNQNNNQAMQSNQRYHADEVEERFAKYKPGVMSEELLTALGIDGNTLPPLIYRMRQLGYPPGWLKEAEMENSGLMLYDGNASNNGNITDNSNSQNISYDVSKLVDFPGFNVPAPDKMKDEFIQYGSTPMQNNHMKQNYAAYLSNNFPMPGATCNKRRHESDSSPQIRKKNRSSPDRTSDRSSDMDIESDPGTPYQSHGPGDFQFQPPLPPGSPCFSSPPPLPQGTPPATPTPPPLPKGTPPPTPTNGSPALRGRNWGVVDETVEGTEDDLTLEELEEQQRLIWAALENADTATNSDCETPAMGTPVPSSPSVSTPAHNDTETEEAEEAMDTMTPGETCPSSENQMESKVQEICSQSPGLIKVEEDSPQSPEPVKAHGNSPQSPGPVRSHDDSPRSPGPVKSHDDSPQSPGPVRSHDDSPRSPGPVKSHDDSPQSPGPVKSHDESPQSPGPVKSHDESPQSPGPVKSHNESPQSPGPVKSHDESPQSPGPVKSHDESPQSPDPVKSQEDNPQSPDLDFSNRGAGDCASPKHVEKITAVPHRSRFAAGIVPFEDTPEFTEVAEATGTYLRIRDLLKSSPRSLAKKK